MRDHDSHLIFYDLNNSVVKISVTANGFEKYMVFFGGKNLVFIDSMQFMNSSLNKRFKNLSDEDFKYLVEEFGSKNLELFKNGAYTYECMNSSKDLRKKTVC